MDTTTPDGPVPADLLAKVQKQMIDTSRGSWEIGTAVQAMLEYHAPALTPFSFAYSPESLCLAPLSSPPHTAVPEYVITAAAKIYDNRPSASACPWGKGKVLWLGGAAGDLGSLVPVLLLGAHAMSRSGDPARAAQYAAAITQQVDYLLHDVPRAPSGALSHRAEQAQFWADFVYMVPPALALCGLHRAGDRALLGWSYEQCRLQREVFVDPATGLWRHIVGGTTGRTDAGCWATSNAWAAAGMLRVLATLRRAREPGPETARREADLLAWVRGILSAAVARAAPSGMVHNYVNEPGSFEESCGTALLAATAFRLAQLRLTDAYVPFAEKARRAVLGHIRESDGILQAVSDIEDEHVDGGRALSAEGQAFVLLLEAAWRDWRQSQDASQA